MSPKYKASNRGPHLIKATKVGDSNLSFVYEVRLLGVISLNNRLVVASKCDLLLMILFHLQESKAV